jgi:hypothetical protein
VQSADSLSAVNELIAASFRKIALEHEMPKSVRIPLGSLRS